MTNFYFASPDYFYLLLCIPFLLVLVFLTKFLRKKPKVPFSSLTLLKGISPSNNIITSLIKYFLLAFTLIFIVASLTDPRATTQIEKSKGTTIILIDISLSMSAKDLSPSRIDVLRDSAIELVQGLPQDSKVGLIYFAGTVNVKNQPTDDKNLIISTLQKLSVDSLKESTATGDALEASLNLLQDYQQNQPANSNQASGVVVLLSDGERTVGKTEEQVIPDFITNKIKVFTVGIGTDQSVDIEFTDPVTGLKQSGTLNPLNETLLTKIAQDTGATYYRAKSNNNFEEIVNKVKETGLTYKENKEINLYYIFLILAAISLVLLLLFFLS